jgi:hypothetical protein
MKEIREMTQSEVAAYVQDHLGSKGIVVVLSGGAAVAIHTTNKYVSHDVDLVNVFMADRKKIKQAMVAMGFREAGRSFEYPETNILIEFPPGPLSVGGEPIEQIDELVLETGTLRVISATECVKDRLSAFYHWGDLQCLSQAILVTRDNPIDLDEVRRWSRKEGMIEKFRAYENELRVKQ